MTSVLTALASHWASFGLPLAASGCPAGSLLALWNAFGWFRGTCGCPLDHLLEFGVTFRANVSFVARLSKKRKPPGICPQSLRAKNCTTKPHVNTRRGQDDVS